jgi:hypothetical protein
MQKPWYMISIFVSVVFVASMFFGYFVCRNSESCTAPFSNISGLSSTEVQSKLLQSKKTNATTKSRLASKRVQQSATVQSILRQSLVSEPVKDTEGVSAVVGYHEIVPDSWFPSNVIVASGDSDGVGNNELNLIRLALYPFRDTLKDVPELHIYIHYKLDALGKGIRAFVTEGGKVMNIIAPNAYSLRQPQISDREYIAILRHEFGHVIHDQVLSSADKKGKIKSDARFSQYAALDEYEALSESLIGLLFVDANTVSNFNDSYKKMYDFLRTKFDILEFAALRDTYTVPTDASKLPKDATRVFNTYVLPEFSV